MKTTIYYIDRAKSEGQFKDDAALARALGWTRAAISLYRNGDRTMQARHCLQLAAMLKLSARETVELIVMAETERSGQLPLDARDYFQRAAVWIGSIALGALIAGVSPTAEASMSATAQGPTHNYDSPSSHATEYKLCDFVVAVIRVLRSACSGFGYPGPIPRGRPETTTLRFA